MNETKQGQSKLLRDGLAYGSLCTKCSTSYKTSSSPEGDFVNSPKNGTVKELVCVCESYQTENPVCLTSPASNKDQIKLRKHKKGKETKNKIKNQIEKLRNEVNLLSLRASHCEGELRLNEKDSQDLKEIIIGLTSIVQDRASKTQGSFCKSCTIT